MLLILVRVLTYQNWVFVSIVYTMYEMYVCGNNIIERYIHILNP